MECLNIASNVMITFGIGIGIVVAIAIGTGFSTADNAEFRWQPDTEPEFFCGLAAVCVLMI